MDKQAKRATASSSIPKSEKIISKYSKTFKLLIKCLKNDLINHSHLNSKSSKVIKEEIPINNNGNEQEKEKKKRGRPKQTKPIIAKAPRVSLPPTSSSLEEDLIDEDLIDVLEETKKKQNNDMVVEENEFDKPKFSFGQSKDNNTYDNKVGIDYKGVNQLFK